MLNEVNLMNIADEILHETKKVLAFFSSQAFPLCIPQNEAVEKFSEEHREIKCVIINSDKSPDLSVLYGIMSAPTLVLFENGKEMKRTSSVLSAEEIEGFVK